MDEWIIKSSGQRMNEYTNAQINQELKEGRKEGINESSVQRMNEYTNAQIN